jgi:F420H(2)-dependent quinone reductase
VVLRWWLRLPRQTAKGPTPVRDTACDQCDDGGISERRAQTVTRSPVLRTLHSDRVTRDLPFRILGGLHRRVYRLTGGTIGGRIANMPVLLLTTIGRKSGRPRTQPLTYTRTTDGYAVIASKGGAAQHPFWYLNLRANPVAQVTIGRDRQKVRAREAEGEERELLWRQLADVYSGYDNYAQKTSRRIPVIVLEPARS